MNTSQTALQKKRKVDKALVRLSLISKRRDYHR